MCDILIIVSVSLPNGGTSLTLEKTCVAMRLDYMMGTSNSTDDCHRWVGSGRVGSCLMPQSHQTFHPVSIVKLLGIMFRKGCWFTAFHTITTGDADGWCQKWPVCSVPQPVSNCDPPSLSFPSFRIGVEMQKL